MRSKKGIPNRRQSILLCGGGLFFGTLWCGGNILFFRIRNAWRAGNTTVISGSAVGIGAAFYHLGNWTVTINRSSSVRTKNLPPQASVKLLAMDETKTAAFRGSILISADKPGGEVITVHGDFVAGDIPDTHLRHAVLRRERNIGAGPLQRILRAVANQILKNPVEALSISMHQNWSFRNFYPPCQLRGAQRFVHFSKGLLKQFSNIQVLQIQGDITRSCFGNLEDVLYNVAKPVSLV